MLCECIALNDAMQTLFDKFGGTRPMADHLGEPPSNVQSWKTAGRIPAGKQPKVLEKAIELKLDVVAEDLIFPLGRPSASAHCSLCDDTRADGEIAACTAVDCPLRARAAA